MPRTIRTCVTARRALNKLLVLEPGRSYCQPCLSPVWDTGLAGHALMEAGGEQRGTGGRAARPRLAGAEAGAGRGRRLGGVAAGPAAGRLGVPIRQPALSRSRRHRRGGDGAGPLRSAPLPRGHRPRRRMDRRHAEPQRRLGRLRRRQQALLTSTTSRSPITARCSIRRPPTWRRAASACWRRSGGDAHRAALDAGARLSAREQEADGCWFGRWGTNYIYGTWSVLCALNAAGVDPPIRR